MVEGTIYLSPQTRQVDGHSEITGMRVYVADELGKMHEVYEWELTQAELSGRRVKDPERRTHLFNPDRNKRRGDPFDPDAPTTPAELRQAVAKLVDRLVRMQREPGEEG